MMLDLKLFMDDSLYFYLTFLQNLQYHGIHSSFRTFFLQHCTAGGT